MQCCGLFWQTAKRSRRRWERTAACWQFKICCKYPAWSIAADNKQAVSVLSGSAMLCRFDRTSLSLTHTQPCDRHENLCSIRLFSSPFWSHKSSRMQHNRIMLPSANWEAVKWGEPPRGNWQPGYYREISQQGCKQRSVNVNRYPNKYANASDTI